MTHRPTRFPITLLAAALALAPAARAGSPDGPYWTEMALPANHVGNISSRGTLVVLQTPTHVHLWSAITREWTAVAVSPLAVVDSFNSYATIIDGNTVHGYASRKGVVDTITMAGPFTLVAGSPSSNWCSFVQAGTDVWGFAGFKGEWVHQSIASTSPSILSTQEVGVVFDGVTAYGFSAYYGTFVGTPAGDAVQLDVNGALAIADGPTTARGFSAHRNLWGTSVLPGTSNYTLERGYALYENGKTIDAFSAYTGTYAHLVTNAFPAIDVGRHVAAVTDGATVWGYAPAVGAFASHAFGAPVIASEEDFLLVQDGSDLTAFSGPLGAWSATLPNATAVDTNTSVALASAVGADYAYSVVENTWSATPVSTANGFEILRNAVVLFAPNGWWGFAGRSGQWHFRASTTPGTYQVNASGDVFVGFEGNVLHAFDPRLGRWSSVATAAPLAGMDLWRTAIVGTDGVNAYGFGLMNNVWDVVPLQGNLVGFDANSACGYVVTDSHVYTYTAHGSLSNVSRWPEFGRYQSRGSDLRLIQAAPAGSQVVFLAGFAPAFIPTGPKGVLFIDPTILNIAPLGTIPASGVLDLAIPVPLDPSLNGVTFHVQHLIHDPATNKTWLTNSTSPVIL